MCVCVCLFVCHRDGKKEGKREGKRERKRGEERGERRLEGEKGECDGLIVRFDGCALSFLGTPAFVFCLQRKQDKPAVFCFSVLYWALSTWLVSSMQQWVQWLEQMSQPHKMLTHSAACPWHRSIACQCGKQVWGVWRESSSDARAAYLWPCGCAWLTWPCHQHCRMGPPWQGEGLGASDNTFSSIAALGRQ